MSSNTTLSHGETMNMRASILLFTILLTANAFARNITQTSCKIIASNAIFRYEEIGNELTKRGFNVDSVSEDSLEKSNMDDLVLNVISANNDGEIKWHGIASMRLEVFKISFWRYERVLEKIFSKEIHTSNDTTSYPDAFLKILKKANLKCLVESQQD